MTDITIPNNLDNKTLEEYELANQIKNAHTAVAGQIPQLDSDSEIEWIDYQTGLTFTMCEFLRVFYDPPHLKYTYRNVSVVNGRLMSVGKWTDAVITTAEVCPEETASPSTASSTASSASTATSASSASASSASTATSESSSSEGLMGMVMDGDVSESRATVSVESGLP